MTEYQKPLKTTKNMTPKADLSISRLDRFLAISCYLGGIFFPMLGLCKKSTFVQLHARQGMLLYTVCVLINVPLLCILIIFSFINIPTFFRFLVWFLLILGNVAIIFFALCGIFMAIMGRHWKIPYGIGDWAERWKTSP
jgi:uncharacterized membrane protein